MKIVATIEARMTSTRLPGKVLLPANNKPLLVHLVDRLKKVPSINEIVLATTINKADDCLVEIAQQCEIAHYRGSEEDVMQRVIDAADASQADVIVEITADCPIIDPDIIEQMIRIFKHNTYDYISNATVRSYPVGMDTQVYWLKALKKSAAMTNDPLDREHVTYHMIKNPQLFSQINIIAPPSLHWPELGLTLDEPKDYELIKLLVEHFADDPYFSCDKVIQLLRNKSEWAEINAAVGRKGYE